MDSQIERLVGIMRRLRAPGGCPWDREQSHESLLKCLIEECYEFYEAVLEKDDAKIAEELGDLLLQVVFHTTLGEENGRFDLNKVASIISDKLERRHPHVFGDVKVDSSAEVVTNWEKIKRGETGNESRKSILDGIPVAMPALLKAHKIQIKAAKVGFDWKEPAPVINKVKEEISEFEAEIAEQNLTKMKSELGDVLFSVVNLARHFGIDPEEALSETNKKFEKRFRGMEQKVSAEGKSLNGMSLEEMDYYWEAEKKKS
ncbi:MAG: nucleoside triphosphate pyrophosphohydrolase [Fibrobacteres bacterium]|nr:nucleoside triphosphate pyrophosphohydrolase [Fibrobacterota bacterium]